ncbi:MAG TPA: glycosyltransferase family 2 protein [Anaeromyxobacteraceae bacterium]|nr:glycosyltransferase family 2 protein [Anaeromyxobacteraceae bacterium]
MRVAVVIPTLNEADAIGRVLDDLPTQHIAEVIVVDGGSTDATREVAAGRGARVLVESRRGYGRACLRGLEQAADADVVVFLDGDYSDRPAELPRLLQPIREGRADIVLGSRLQTGVSGGAMPWHQVLGNRLGAALIRALYGVPLTDLGPFRAARGDVLRALRLSEMTYGWAVELPTLGARHGYRVAEVPVSYHRRIGISKISGTAKGTLGAAWCILTGIILNRLRPRPRPGGAPPAA